MVRSSECGPEAVFCLPIPLEAKPSILHHSAPRSCSFSPRLHSCPRRFLTHSARVPLRRLPTARACRGGRPGAGSATNSGCATCLKERPCTRRGTRCVCRACLQDSATAYIVVYLYIYVYSMYVCMYVCIRAALTTILLHTDDYLYVYKEFILYTGDCFSVSVAWTQCAGTDDCSSIHRRLFS
jgi:hypothetical protein